MDDECFIYKLHFTVSELPKTGGLLFICKGGPPFNLNNEILSKRSLVVDRYGRLGLIVGNVEVNALLNSLRVSNDAMIKFYEKKGAMKKGVKRYIEIHTVLEPSNFAGSTKVLLDGEVVLLYMVDKLQGIY